MNAPTWHLVVEPRVPRVDAWRQISPPLLAGADDPEKYIADQELIDAANVAIELGQPLLLTGEPGCGKSSFADHIAWQLGLGKALRFQCRTSMEARDLFYGYDDLGRFRAAQERAQDSYAMDPGRYVTLHALGRAILQAADPRVVGDLRQRLLPDADPEQRRAVVLIDEIDKAPRDVTNDLLGFVNAERQWFRIPELETGGGKLVEISASPAFQPIIVCTSNSEKSLPDPFLRRCVFHHIPFPDGKRLRGIVASRIRAFAEDEPLVADAEKLMMRLRNTPGLAKKPGTAELLGFLLALKARGYDGDRRLGRSGDGWQRLAVMTLLKTDDDQSRARSIITDFEPG